jgi:integrase
MKNVRRTAYGWQLYTRVRGRFVSEHQTTEPTALQVRDWIHTQHAIGAGSVAAPASGTTFAQDVAAYLQQVQTMPTFRWRKDDLDRWIAALGGQRPRASITASVIRTQLEQWRADGYAASTVNHRRTALMHLWSVLDGRSAQNPARDVPRYPEDPRPPGGLSPAAVRAVFAAMPASQTKARLQLMAWTGWPQAQIARLEPADIVWNRAVFIRGRKKGKGVPGAWLPLLPQAWTALRLFKRLGCWGPFSTSSMRTSFRLAAQHVAEDKMTSKAIRAELQDVTPYQLRHSFGTLLAGITQDDRAVKTLMLHADIRQTHRYTSATVDGRAADAVRKVARSVASRRGSKKAGRNVA